MNRWEALPEPPEQVHVIVEGQIGVEAADNVEFRHRFGPAFARLAEGILERHRVGARGVGLAAERAQFATRDADVGRVDVPVDVKISSRALKFLPDAMRKPAERQQIVRAVKRRAVVEVQPLFGEHFLGDGPKPRVFEVGYAPFFHGRIPSGSI